MKFALISADKSHGVKFKIDCRSGDCTSFMNWVDVFDGFHFSFDVFRERGREVLKDFDIVMMSGSQYHMVDIFEIATMLKDSNAVSVYYPEGSTQLYDGSINIFHQAYYNAWNACDILSIAEEDKESYYKKFIRSDTIVKFIHVPTRVEIENAFVPREWKRNFSCVYGDNNPNHPLIAIACASEVVPEIATVCIDTGKLKFIQDMFPSTKFHEFAKLSQIAFMNVLSRSLVNFYPTEWIGTARHQVACALVGTPCIGNRDSHTQRRLFPKLGAYIYDVDSMIRIAKELISNETFYKECAEFARREVEFYNLENTKARFVSAVEEVRAKKGKVSVSTAI